MSLAKAYADRNPRKYITVSKGFDKEVAVRKPTKGGLMSSWMSMLGREARISASSSSGRSFVCVFSASGFGV